MATITYNTVKVIIGTMSWAQALLFSKEFISFVETHEDDSRTVMDTIGAYFAVYAPHKIFVNGNLIQERENHLQTIVVQVNADESFTITLPLTLDTFRQLPGPLAADWIEAAAEQNEWLLKRLDFLVSRAILNISVPLPGSGLSSEPTIASE